MQHRVFLLLIVYRDPFYLSEPFKNNSCPWSQTTHERLFLQERYKIPYIVPQIINVFLENDFTSKVPQIVTHGLVLFLFLSKRWHHFWWGHLFTELELFHPAWDGLNHKGFSCLLQGVSVMKHTQLHFFLSEEISFLKAAATFFPKTNDFSLLFFWHISLTKNSFELICLLWGLKPKAHRSDHTTSPAH